MKQLKKPTGEVPISTESEKDEDEQIYEDHLREESSPDIIKTGLKEENESTSESDAEVFEDAALNVLQEGSSTKDRGEKFSHVEKQEGISELFPGQKATLVVAAEQDLRTDEEKEILKGDEALLPKETGVQSGTNTVGEPMKDMPSPTAKGAERGEDEEVYKDCFREEWLPDIIKTGEKEARDASVEYSDEDHFKDMKYTEQSLKKTFYHQAITDDAREVKAEEPTVSDAPKGTFTVETSAEDRAFTGTSEIETGKSGYLGNLSIEPSVDNVQLYEIPPQPERSVFHLDSLTTDIHLKGRERVTAKVDKPESMIEFTPSPPVVKEKRC